MTSSTASRWALLGLVVALPSCGPTLSATAVSLRNCVEQEATAEGRLACMKRVSPPEGEPAKCSEGRSFGSDVIYQPIDDKRRDDLQNDVKYLRHEAWEAVANAPFVYDVDWGSSLVGAESNNATEWIRGALLGRDASLTLGTSAETRGLIDMSIRRDGKLIDDFVNDAPASMLREAVDGLAKVSERLVALRKDVHELFSGLFLGLDKVNATTTCYHDFAAAERRMQESITSFHGAIDSSRKRLEERFGSRSSEEAEQLREDRAAWEKSDATSCRTPKKASDCDGIDGYIAQFPSGEHAEEAKQILASVVGVIGPMRDEAAWKNARVADCRSPRTSDACDGVKTYVEAHPRGNHADEANQMLRLKRGALVQLAAIEEQRRRIAAVRAQQQCIQACATALRACQGECRAGAAESLGPCQRSCLEAFNGTCVPACKK